MVDLDLCLVSGLAGYDRLSLHVSYKDMGMPNMERPFYVYVEMENLELVTGDVHASIYESFWLKW